MVKVKQICPVCGEGELQPRSDRVYEFTVGRQKQVVNGLEHSVCSACETSICTPEQMDRNADRIEAVQASVKGYISPEKVSELRARYNLTQALASKIFGGGPNAFSKYERGEVSPSASAASVMLLALESPVVFRELAKLRGVALDEADATATMKVVARGMAVKLVSPRPETVGRSIGVCSYGKATTLERDSRFGHLIDVSVSEQGVVLRRPDVYVGIKSARKVGVAKSASLKRKYVRQPFHKTAVI